MKNSRTVIWTSWAIASFFYAYQYIIRVMPSVMFTPIMQKFHMDAALFGQFSGIYYIGYALIHIPMGLMLDKYGPKKVVSTCILLTVLGLTPLIFADHWVYPVIGRLFIGIGSSAAILGVFKVIRMSFDEKNFARMLSWSVTIGLIGAIYGGAPMSMVLHAFGYHAVIIICGLIGLGLAAITYCVMPNIEQTKETSIKDAVFTVMSNRYVLACCFFAGMMVGPLEGFADVWGTEFLKQAYGFSPALAASLPSMIFIGMCFGSPVLTFIAEKTGSFIATIIGSGIIMSLCFAALLSMQLNYLAIATSFFLVGICCAYQILAIYKASTFVEPEFAGLTTAVANMIIMSFGYFFHTVIGLIIDFHFAHSQKMVFEQGISVIPIALLIGALGFWWLKKIELHSNNS